MQVSESQAPGYSTVIKNSMDLSTMKKKLHKYSNILEFEQDLKLMFDNCRKFNGDNSLFSSVSINCICY